MLYARSGGNQIARRLCLVTFHDRYLGRRLGNMKIELFDSSRASLIGINRVVFMVTLVI